MVRLFATLMAAAALGCATPASTPPPRSSPAPAPGAEPGEVLLRFAEAARAGRWSEAWPLLSERWRSSTTPARLAADWRGAGPVAREAADRVVVLLASGEAPAGEGDVRRLAVGQGRAARLVREQDGWRVDALE